MKHGLDVAGYIMLSWDTLLVHVSGSGRGYSGLRSVFGNLKRIFQTLQINEDDTVARTFFAIAFFGLRRLPQSH
jgi:hypothetical protein